MAAWKAAIFCVTTFGEMTLRQRILKIVYPLVLKFGKLTSAQTRLVNSRGIPPPASFYDLKVQLNNGHDMSFHSLKGKKVLLVNTASNCGYTNQYAELQKLYENQKERLEVIGFPANDFKEQEKGTDEEIAQFCQVNFGVSFPLVRKSTVKKSPHQHPVFQWLSQKNKNGWNDKEPNWNFSKYLVDEAGVLTHFFDPAVSPLSKEVVQAVEQ
jgi:glutathione peroxidase